MGMSGFRMYGCVLTAVLGFIAQPTPAHSGDAYYLLVLSGQRIPNDPKYSHTFATFVRVYWDGEGPCPANAQIEAHTISWLPTSLKIRVSALCAEPGGNFGLHETIDYLRAMDERVSLWGPYAIQPELFYKALRRKENLEGGTVRYKANDMLRNDAKVSNCIHAVAAVAEGPRLVVLVPGWGEIASYAVLKELSPWVINTECPNYQISSALGLDQYPIIYRDGLAPRSGAILGPVYRFLGGERELPGTSPYENKKKGRLTSAKSQPRFNHPPEEHLPSNASSTMANPS